MEYVRDFDSGKVKNDKLNDYIILKLIQLIAPIAPHLAEEMWRQTGNVESVFKSQWPEYDPNAIVFENISIAVQVNGKLRGLLDINRDAPEDEVINLALNDARIKNHLDGKAIIKKIYIRNKLLNLVIK